MMVNHNMLTRDQILAAQDIPAPVPVDVPEWGGTVFVRVMSGTERDAWEAASLKIQGTGKKTSAVPNLENARARLCALCLCDEHGKRLFSNNDVAELGKKNARALDRVYDKASQINGITDKDVEDILGNSSADQSASSGSGSPSSTESP